MDSYYLSNQGALVYLSTQKTLIGCKIWATKYCGWGIDGARRGSDIYIKDGDLTVAMRINGIWVCYETDSKRRERCGAIVLDARS